jgi:hypothetical protein
LNGHDVAANVRAPKPDGKSHGKHRERQSN